MEHMAREMKLHMNTSETSLHEFDAAILQPLRIQIMGSIVVMIKCIFTFIIIMIRSYMTWLFGDQFDGMLIASY